VRISTCADIFLVARIYATDLDRPIAPIFTFFQVSSYDIFSINGLKRVL